MCSNLAILPVSKTFPNNKWKGGISIGDKKKDYDRFKCLERHARKMSSGGSHTLDDWNSLKKKHNYTCLRCKRKEPKILLTQDHIIPLIYGGSDNIINIQPLCKSCNSIKHTSKTDYTKSLIA